MDSYRPYVGIGPEQSLEQYRKRPKKGLGLIPGSTMLVGHPQARDTIKDGHYESCVRERVNLTPMPGRPEVNHLTQLAIWALFFVGVRSVGLGERNTSRNYRFGTLI